MPSSSPVNLKHLEVISYTIISRTELFFKRLGEIVARNPWRVVIICPAIVCLTLFGFFRFHQEKNPIKLWVPPDSGFAHDTEWLMKTFNQAYRPELMLVEANDVLVPEVLQEIYAIRNQVKHSITADNITWPSVCFKIPVVDDGLVSIMMRQTKNLDDIIDSGLEDSFMYCVFVESMKRDCYEKNFLKLWNYQNQFMNTSKEDIVDKLANSDKILSPGLSINYESLLGGVERNESGHIISAKSLLSFWMVDVKFSEVDMDKTGNDLGTADWATEETLKWENKFIQIMENASKNAKDMQIYYSSSRSFSDISGATMLQNIPALAAGVILMVIYIQVSYSKYNCVESRILIGFLGLLSIGMAFLATCGICSLFGIFYGPVHTSLPFLLMGLGVDDMFVIMACWNQLSPQQKRLPLPERVGFMLQHAGVSMTITSITDFMAFLVGSFTILPSLKSFCIYAGIGVLATFLLVITFFTACFTLDQERSEQNRNSIVPCYIHTNTEKNECSQRQFSSMIFRVFYDKIILTTPGKIGVLILTAILTGFAIDGILKLKQEFDPMWFVPENTYFHQYIRKQKFYYPRMGFEAGLYIGRVNYTHEYKNIRELVAVLENQTDILQLTSSWVEPFHDYVEKKLKRDIHNEILSDDEWNTYLSKWLFTPKGAKYQANIKFERKLQCGSPASQITASSIEFRLRVFKGSHDHIPALNRLYKIKDGANFTTGDRFATVWAKVFANWVTDEVIDKELARNLGLALLSVMCCTIILIANLQICFWIFICVSLTMVNVCGWMQKWDLTIDLVSCIALTLAVGLCVDYAAHIGYTYLSLSEGSKRERALHTVSHIGIAVLHGGLSTLLALSMLANSEAYTFQAFFKIFLLVVVFGQFHGIILLPVILSTIGPKPYQHVPKTVDSSLQ